MRQVNVDIGMICSCARRKIIMHTVCLGSAAIPGNHTLDRVYGQHVVGVARAARLTWLNGLCRFRALV